MSVEKENWKAKTESIESKNDFLNGLEFNKVSSIQQMLYLVYKKIEELEKEIEELKKEIESPKGGV